MAVTTQESTQVANPKLTPSVQNPAADSGGRLRSEYFSFTQSGVGDPNSIARLIKIRSGVLRLTSIYIAFSAYGAARTLDLGYEAHSDSDGEPITEDPIVFAQDIDVSVAGDLSIEVNQKFETNFGFAIVARAQGGTIPDGASLEGYALYAQD